MLLTYRGQQYNVTSTQVATVASGFTATYRGMNYPMVQSNSVATIPTANLKYRGVSYAKVTVKPTETGYFPEVGSAMA